MTTGTGELQVDALAARVAERHRKASMIVLAIAASVVLYVAIALYLVSLKPPRGLADQTRIGFYAVAAFLALGSIFYRRSQTGRTRLEVIAGLRGIEGLLKHFFQVTVISIVMADLIGILALLVSFFGGNQNDVARFGVVAIAVALYNYPRRRSWQQAASYFAETMPGIDK